VPTAAPTPPPTVVTTSPPTPPPVPGASIVPSVSPTVTSTTSDLCVTFVVSMTDSWGDGWNGNYLYFDEPENMQTTTRKVTLPSGHSGSATLCLPAGTYSPFACGGSWKNEVGWTIEGYGISGGAGSCQPVAGNSFVLLADGQTVPPTLVPTPSPTLSPTSAPTECPTERTVTVHMSDSYGDGWNGNHLYFDDVGSMTTTEYKMTFWSGYSKTKSICLPAGTYSPFACGGGWPYECSWVIEGHDISGGASSSCTPNSGSFTVSDGGDGGCCCDDKINQVLANQDTMMGFPTSSSADTAGESASPESAGSSEVAVDVVALVVGTVVFAGVFTGTVAVAFFNRERYLALDAAYSAGEPSSRSLA